MGCGGGGLGARLTQPPPSSVRRLIGVPQALDHSVETTDLNSTGTPSTGVDGL